MPYLLNLLYLTLIFLSLPWLVWQSVRKGKYREGFSAKFLGRVPRREGDRPCVWFHAVSVGEVNVLAPLLGAVARRKPEWECVISTTTMTGMALARKKYAGHPVFYCPLDFSWAVRSAMRRIRPDLLVLAETEIWPNLVSTARRCGAAVTIVNGRLGEKSFRGYRRIRPLAATILRQFDLVAVQNETYAERFRRLGARPETIAVTGSMKYDGAQTDRANLATERLRRLAGFAAEDVVFLAGSTQDPEEAAALAAFRTLCDQWPRLRLVLVPRHPDRFDSVARLLDASGLPWQRRTALSEEPESGGAEPEGLEYDSPGHRPGNREESRSFALKGQDTFRDISPIQGSRGVGDPPTQGVALGFRIPALQADGARRGSPDPAEIGDRRSQPDSGDLRSPHGCGRETAPERGCRSPRILLIDTVGELGAWWGTAEIAFVGGSFGSRGGQNMIEPAAYGAAVCFGPNTWNFRDIVAAMLDRQAAVVVGNPDELTAFVRRCLAEPDYGAALGTNAQALVASQLGATDRTLERLVPLVDGLTLAPVK